MKHLYSLLFLLAITAGNVSAQRNADLELVSSITNPDTFLYNSTANGGAKTGFIVSYKIINHGPDKVLQTDTVKMRLQYAGYPTPTTINKTSFSLYFDSSVPGINAGDSAFYVDTFYFSTSYGANPYLWCDSIWGRSQGGGSAWNDGDMTNNRACRSIRFSQDPAFVADLNASTEKLVVYPNPAGSNINVNFDFGVYAANARLTIRDVIGKEVYIQNLEQNLSGKKKYTIATDNLSTGLYVVELSVKDARHVSTVHVQK